MKCEKCGNEICRLKIDMFNHDGSDNFYSYIFDEVEKNVVVEIDKNWTGYELSEEEQIETIVCPYCGEFPFKDKEIQVYEIVRLVMFKNGKEHENGN